jgi:hypothetical protein
MSKSLKVREVITLKGWVDGSGWSYTQTYSDNIIDVHDVPMTAEEYDWSWWETDIDNPPSEDEDTKIIVTLYAEDADISEDEPLASFEKWDSEIWTERHAE